MSINPTAKSSSRREFLVRSVLASLAALLPRRAAALLRARLDEDRSKLARDPMRPQFHLLPARNWMNDPNGPIYFNGRYHMFFQYNPEGPTWGNMSWNHAVSPDMLHWTHRSLAMTPTPGSFDSFGVFSGSALQVGKRVYVVYTGTKESTPELATIRDGQNKIEESQCLAWSDDPELNIWTKAPAPIIPVPPAGMKITGFRDPSAWRQGEWYYMVVASGVARVGGCVLLYRSRDLRKWNYLHPLTSGVWNGILTANPCDDGEMWECPDFFALDGGHVLIYSTLGKVFWQSGVFNEKELTFTPSKTGLLDLDAFYAPKTQLDAQGRRILWGWIPERRDDTAMRAAGWSGMMSLPRVLNLDRDRTLRMQVLPEAAGLRGEAIPSSVADGQRVVVLRGAVGEAHWSGEKGSSFECSIGSGAETLVRITYTGESHRMSVDGKDVSLNAGDKPSMDVWVDGSVIEMIVGNRIGYTKRFYYEGPAAPDILIRSSKPAMQYGAWRIKAISDDRLTTPFVAQASAK